MYKVGMYGGSFNPLHMGHIKVITKAYTMCEELYILLCVSKSDKEIDVSIRYGWLHQATKHMNKVHILVIEDESLDKQSYNWQLETQKVKALIKKPIDIIFYGDDYQKQNPFKTYYPQSHHYIIPRDTLSSSRIRSNPFQYWQDIPVFARPYYTKKILIVGTESCAKSTLTKQLALYFNTNCVQETGRDICENAGHIDYMSNEDYYQILIQHKYIENKELEKANKIMFIDTSQIVTAYYASITKRTDSKNIERLAKMMFETMSYDLILYLQPDVKWVQDGTRTFGEANIRKQNNDLLLSMYEDYLDKIILIDGNYHQRFEKAIQIIQSKYPLT